MRIGLVIYGSLDTLSGGYLYDRRLVEHLRAQGDTVEMLSLPWRNYGAHLADNLSFRLPPGLDLIIQDELNHPSLLAANRRPHPCPVISLVHHLRCSELRPAWQNACYRVVERGYLRSVDGFIFNSKTTRGVVHALAGDARPNLVAYPPTDRFGSPLPAGLVRSRAADPAPLRIVFLGNVIPRKGLHTLLEAIGFQLSAFSGPRSAFRLDVVGSLRADPPYAQKMQRLSTVHGLRSAVRFHGPLDNGRLAALLKTSHVLVVPSSYEGFGIVYLEGMAFGLPAIGTVAGAAAEIITDGENGYLIAPDDARTLAARLAALAVDRLLLERLALNAIDRYRRQPTWEQTAGSIRQFLLSLT